MSESKNTASMSSFQPSMTEWLAAIGDADGSIRFREEDNRKAERLEILYREAGIAYERPERFPASELVERSSAFRKLLAERGQKACAIRLVPNRPDLPKLRHRGWPLQRTYDEWFLKQEIDPALYTAEVCPHSDTLLWSSILVIKSGVIFGEIIRGMHAQLTHGDTQEIPIRFKADADGWHWSSRDAEAETHVQKMLDVITIHDATVQERLLTSLDAAFDQGRLCGYLEFTVWPDGTTYLIDYNRVLPDVLEAPRLEDQTSPNDSDVRGSAAFPGIARGRVRRISAETMATAVFESGDILVCDNTDVRFLPLMQRAGAIVTDRGGILSHAAIVARELKKPCIIGTKDATKKLTDGQMVEVDAEQGRVRLF